MNRLRALWVMNLMIVLGGTAFGQAVTSTYDKDYGLSKLRRYEFKAEEREKTDPLASDTVTEKKIKDALDDELQAKGYQPAPAGTAPDFLVAFHVRVKDRTAERGRDRDYVQGTLIVDFYDAETKRLVWRGIATGVVGAEAVDLKLAEEMVKGAAKLLLEQFSKDLSSGF